MPEQVPCPRLDEHGNPLPCPFNDWTYSLVDEDPTDGIHHEKRCCNKCGRSVLELRQGELPAEE